MIECDGCGRQLRDNVEYCRVCGTKIDGVAGDYSTDMLNVFKHGEEYIYVFAEKGNQVILNADSLEELADRVQDKKYPWQFKNWKSNSQPQKKERVLIPKLKSEFLKASSLKEVEIIPTASTRKQDNESYVPEYEIEKVGE